MNRLLGQHLLDSLSTKKEVASFGRDDYSLINYNPINTTSSNYGGFAVTISADGNTWAEGAYGKSNYTGNASIYKFSNNIWNEYPITPSDGVANDIFGSTLILSQNGNKLLVGAPGFQSDRGKAYIYSIDQNLREETIISSDGSNADLFGTALAISTTGTQIAIGAFGNSNYTGAIYLFSSNAGIWNQTKLTASDGNYGDYYGSYISMNNDGNTILVGANGKNTSTGGAYIYQWSGSSWNETILTASDAAINDAFGSAVSLSYDGNIAAISAFGKNNSAGAVYLYKYTFNTWKPYKIIASDTFPYSAFGYSISLANDYTLLVGAPSKNNSIGGAYVYQWNGISWNENKLNPSNGSIGDAFGSTVTLSSDGTTAFIGSYAKNSNQGAIYRYRKDTVDPSLNWQETKIIVSGNINDNYGYSIATSSTGNRMTVGAYGKNNFQGSSYIYNKYISTAIRLYDNNLPSKGVLLTMQDSKLSIVRDSSLPTNVGIGTNIVGNSALYVKGDTQVTGTISSSNLYIYGNITHSETNPIIDATVQLSLYKPSSNLYKAIVTNDTVLENLTLFTFQVTSGKYVVYGNIPYITNDIVNALSIDNIGLYTGTPTLYSTIPSQTTPLTILTTNEYSSTSFLFYIEVTDTTDFVIAVAGKGNNITFGGNGYTITAIVSSLYNTQYIGNEPLQSAPLFQTIKPTLPTNIFTLQVSGVYKGQSVELFYNGSNIRTNTTSYITSIGDTIANTVYQIQTPIIAYPSDIIDIILFPQVLAPMYQDYIYNTGINPPFYQINNNWILGTSSNLGIGTIPNYKLDIYGNMNINGDLFIQKNNPMTRINSTTYISSSNVGIQTNHYIAPLTVYGDMYISNTTTASTLVLLGNIIYPNSNNLRASLQIKPIRVPFIVSTSPQTLFTFTEIGEYYSDSKNIDVYMNGSKLSWYSASINDYVASVSYDTILNITTFIITLNQSADAGDIIDIYIYPINTFETTNKWIQGGYLFQNITMPVWSKLISSYSSNNNLFISEGTSIGIGTNIPLATLNINNSNNIFKVQIGTSNIWVIDSNIGCGTLPTSNLLTIQGNLIANNITINTNQSFQTINASSATIGIVNTTMENTNIVTASNIRISNFSIANMIASNVTVPNINSSNINASNAITTFVSASNIITSNITISTINTSSINTLNINVQNSISDTLNIPLKQYYNGAYIPLNGSVANSNVFLDWLTTLTNDSYTAWWLQPNLSIRTNFSHGQGATTIFSDAVYLLNGLLIMTPLSATAIGIYNTNTNIYTRGATHGETTPAFNGSVVLPNGVVCFIPASSLYIGFYDANTVAYTRGPAHGRGVTFAFNGGVLIPNGNVILVPNNSSLIGIYNTISGTYINGPLHGLGANTNAFYGGVLMANGNVLLVPYNASVIGIYNPITNTYTSGPAHGRGAAAFNGGVLMSNGNVLLVPYNSSVIGIYNPVTNTYTNGPAHGQAAGAFNGGVLHPNGTIFLIPYNSLFVALYNPITNAITLGTNHGQTIPAYAGGSLLPSGNIVLIPSSAVKIGILTGNTPVPIEFCIHPCFNKF